MPDGKYMFDPFRGEQKNAPANPRSQNPWTTIVPVPDDAPVAPAEHYSRGQPSESWTYRDGEGRLLGYVWRFDRPDGGKDILPLTYCRSTNSDGCEWRWKSWEKPRPLYGLDRLAKFKTGLVVICEGEKAADAAQVMLDDIAVVASPGGSKAAQACDWSPLTDRDVVIWPDADEAGERYARDVCEALSK